MNARAITIQLGLAAASVAFAALFTECALATFRPQDLSVWAHTRDGLVLHPASRETYLPRYGHAVRTNAWGMRDREHALEKPDGAFRALVLGDSFMEAFQVIFEESLPGLLPGALSRRGGREIEVVNASTSGWGTDDQIAYLERYGLRFQPDLVLVAMTLHNDVSDNLQLEHHELRAGSVIPRPPSEKGAWEWASIRLRDSIANRSHLYSVYRRLKTVRRSRSEAGLLDAHVASLLRRHLDRETAAAWDVTKQMLERARDVARNGGAEFAVVLLPLGLQVSEEWRERFLTGHALREEELDLEQPQRIVAEWAAHADVTVIDLLPAFRAASAHGTPLYLEGDGHWNREGHAVAGEVVAGELLARGLVPPATPRSN